MTEEISNTEVEVQLTEAEQTAADEAAFADGFNGVRTDDEPVIQVAEKPELKQEAEGTAAEEVKTEATDEPTKVLAGLTEEEVKTLFAKAAHVDDLIAQQQKAFGKIGELNQTLQQLKAQPKQTGGVLEIKALKRFSENYPEEAEDLLKDLQDAGVTAIEQTPGIDEARTGELITAAMSQQEQAFETRLLKVMQPDYQQQMAQPDWAIWKSTLPPEEQGVLDNSWDANVLSERFNAFKEWKGAAMTGANKRQQRLANSIQPTGSGAAKRQTTQDDEAAFIAGFNSA